MHFCLRKAAYIYFICCMYTEELSWKSNVCYLATCPIKNLEGLSDRES